MTITSNDHNLSEREFLNYKFSVFLKAEQIPPTQKTNDITFMQIISCIVE